MVSVCFKRSCCHPLSLRGSLSVYLALCLSLSVQCTDRERQLSLSIKKIHQRNAQNLNTVMAVAPPSVASGVVINKYCMLATVNVSHTLRDVSPSLQQRTRFIGVVSSSCVQVYIALTRVEPVSRCGGGCPTRAHHGVPVGPLAPHRGPCGVTDPT